MTGVLFRVAPAAAAAGKSGRSIRRLLLGVHFWFALVFVLVEGEALDPLQNFCKRWDQQTTIMGGKVYMDGGSEVFVQRNLTASGDQKAAGVKTVGINTHLISIDLAKAFNWRKSIPAVIVDNGTSYGSSNKATSRPPGLVGGTLFPVEKNSTLYLYGGTTSLLNESFPGYVAPTSDETVMWKYKVEQRTWSAVDLAVPSGQKIPRASRGASAVAPELGLGFYMGGQMDNGTSEQSASIYGAQFLNDFLVFDFEAESARSYTMGERGRSGGEMVFVPGIGDKGILVMIGGSLKDTNNLNADLWGDSISMEQISIYDIASLGTGNDGAGTWYTQNATGEIPSPRMGFCATLVTAQDKSSYNIYIYGGWNGINHYDDIYVLSLPSFKYVKLFQGTDEREFHTCHLIGNRQLLTIGGRRGGEELPGSCDWEDHGVSIFDMSTLEWSSTYDPSAALYVLPPNITAVIGGNATGNATSTAPVKGWVSGLNTVFKAEVLTTASPTPTPIPKPTTAPKKASHPRRTIVGLAVGGVLVLSLAIFVAFRLRQRSKLRPKEDWSEVEKKAVEIEGKPAASELDPSVQRYEIGEGGVGHMAELEAVYVTPKAPRSNDGTHSELYGEGIPKHAEDKV